MEVSIPDTADPEITTAAPMRDAKKTAAKSEVAWGSSHVTSENTKKFAGKSEVAAWNADAWGSGGEYGWESSSQNVATRRTPAWTKKTAAKPEVAWESSHVTPEDIKKSASNSEVASWNADEWGSACEYAWENSSQNAATSRSSSWKKSEWKPTSAHGAEDEEEDPVGDILVYMRDNTASKDGGPVMKVELSEFEATILGMIRDLTEDQRKEFAECTEQKGRRASPMWYSTWTNAEQIAKLLIEIRAKIDHVDGSRGRTPLWEAASQGHEALVLMLINLEADLNVQTYCGTTPGDKKGKTPFEMAEARGHDEVMRLLLDAKADVAARNASASKEEVAQPTITTSSSNEEKLQFLKDVALMSPLSQDAALRDVLERSGHDTTRLDAAATDETASKACELQEAKEEVEADVDAKTDSE